MIAPSYDENGLVVLRPVDIVANLRERFAASPHFGPDLKSGPDSAYGQLFFGFGEELGEGYSLLRAIVDSDNPDAAEGVPLDRLAGLTLLRREPATYSRVNLLLTGIVATVIAAGKRARIHDGSLWALDEDAVIPIEGTVEAWATCTALGAELANEGSITEIVDAVAGWAAVTNPAAVSAEDTAGQNQETDEEFRQRREDSLALAGSGTDPASKARLEALDYITTALVISNRSDVTLPSGQPPHSTMVFVFPDPTDPDLFCEDCYLAGLPVGGTRMHGSITRRITDRQGYPIDISYTPAKELHTHWIIEKTLDTEGDPFPADGDDQIIAAVLGYGNSLEVGRDVLPDLAKGWILMGWTDSEGVAHDAVPGLAALKVRVKFSAAPGADDTIPLTVDLTEIARTDIAHVTVTG